MAQAFVPKGKAEGYMQNWLFMALLLWLGGCQVMSLPSRDQPRLQQGMLDLRNWNFEQQGNISLQGDWLFEAGAFLDPSTADPLRISGKTPIPGSPNASPLYI